MSPPAPDRQRTETRRRTPAAQSLKPPHHSLVGKPNPFFQVRELRPWEAKAQGQILGPSTSSMRRSCTLRCAHRSWERQSRSCFAGTAPSRLTSLPQARYAGTGTDTERGKTRSISSCKSAACKPCPATTPPHRPSHFLQPARWTRHRRHQRANVPRPGPACGIAASGAASSGGIGRRRSKPARLASRRRYACP